MKTFRLLIWPLAVVTAAAGFYVIRRVTREIPMAELVAELERHGGKAVFTGHGQPDEKLSSIEIASGTPDEVWHALFQRGQPTLVICNDMSIDEADWHLFGSTTALRLLRLVDCTYDEASLQPDVIPKLHELSILATNERLTCFAFFGQCDILFWRAHEEPSDGAEEVREGVEWEAA